MKDFKPGTRCMVSEGAGLETGHIGTVVDHRRYSQNAIKRDEPGRYKPFDSKKEVLLIDKNGHLFAMFPQYLRRLPVPEQFVVQWRYVYATFSNSSWHTWGYMDEIPEILPENRRFTPMTWMLEDAIAAMTAERERFRTAIKLPANGVDFRILAYVDLVKDNPQSWARTSFVTVRGE